MTPPPARGVLLWQIKDSLVAYMRADPSFTVSISGAARFDERDGVVLDVERDASGRIRATGSVTLSAHGGALAVPLRNVTVTEGALWIDDPFEDGDTAPSRLRLVEVAAATGADPEARQTRLASESDILFSYRYPAGTTFAPLYLRFPAIGEGGPADDGR